MVLAQSPKAISEQFRAGLSSCQPKTGRPLYNPAEGADGERLPGTHGDEPVFAHSF